MLGLRTSPFSMAQVFEKIPLVSLGVANDEKDSIDLPLPTRQNLHLIEPRTT